MYRLPEVIATVFYVWIYSFITNVQVEAYFDNDVNLPNVEILDGWHRRDIRVAVGNNNQAICDRPNFYICEEPPDAIPIGSGKICNFRNEFHHEQIYRWRAGRACLLYTPDFLYVGGFNSMNMTTRCIYQNWLAPCLEIVKDDGSCGCYPFDPAFEEVALAVREAVIPLAHGRWEKCFYAAADCCSHYMTDTLNISDTHCQTSFDGWTCWQPAEAGTTAYEVCAEFAYSNTGPSCHHYSSKECYANATWELQTDYSTCSITSRLLRRYRFHIAVLSFSIASCIPAVFIFLYYKRLRITRVALHRNLLIVIIIRNILMIITRSEVYIDELTNSGDTTMSTHGVACRILAVAERTASNAVFVCMLVEGIYLHRLIVAVFKQKLNMKVLYAIGGVITIAPVIAWSTVMATHDDHSCWLVYTIEHVQWILDAPRVTILLINTGLFIDVLRVLLTKIRNSENANQLSTTKATLFLMPLFGTQFLLTAFRPNTNNCTSEQAYYYITYSLEGLQGFIVAILYCYINKEVHTLVKASYRKTENAIVSRVRGDSREPRQSFGPLSDRRITYSTALPSTANNDLKDQYASIKPKLHVAEIISIQASERLAEILDPVYETIENGCTNEGYDSLERSDIDTDSGFIPNKDSFKTEDYYGFTNASSISIDCQDWIRPISSDSSSFYNSSLNNYDSNYLERKDPNIKHTALELSKDQDNEKVETASNTIALENDNVANMNYNDNNGESIKIDTDVEDNIEYQDCDDNMLEEILQYMGTKENHDVSLNPDLLSPNRKDEDKIVFVDE